jgi:hypothetical protein
MRIFNRKIGLVLLLSCAFSLAAAPIGSFSTGITPGGGVRGDAVTIDWYLPNGTGFGDFTTGGGSLTYFDGVSTVTLDASTNPYGRIADLSVLAPAPIPFLSWYPGTGPNAHTVGVPGSGTPQAVPYFRLDSLPAEALPDCTVDPAPGQSCRPLVNANAAGPGLPPVSYQSPIVLTNGVIGTGIRLSMNLTGFDAAGSLPWTAVVTAQKDGVTPSQIQAMINAGQTVNLTSWSLDANGIPEPATIAFVGSGLVLLGFVARRRK